MSTFDNNVTGQPGADPGCINDALYEHCNNSECCHLNELLAELCGATWRELLFRGCVDSSSLHDYNDEILLYSLSKPDDPRVHLHKLLQQKTKKARLANRLVGNAAAITMIFHRQWRLISFCAAVKRLCATGCPVGAGMRCALRFCPAPLLALLNLRLGCALTRTCCTIHCYLGVECQPLVFNDAPKFALADAGSMNYNFLRVVFVGHTTPADFTPLITFSPADCSRSLALSVRDSSEAAAIWPMQLTALRASLCHRMYKYLQMHWRCPLIGLARKPAASTGSEVLNFLSAAF